jgi:hypothetical protein
LKTHIKAKIVKFKLYVIHAAKVFHPCTFEIENVWDEKLLNIILGFSHE